MSQLARPVDPFGEVNLHRLENGDLQIIATILMEPDLEGARAGLALDASASMKAMYGHTTLSPIFQKASGVINVVQPVARTMTAYLARFSTSGSAHLIYWACAPDGTQVEPLGDFTEAMADKLEVRGPRRFPWGRKTMLLPPVQYFAQTAFPDAPWAICVFVTDGVIDDLEAVKQFSWNLARDIADGRRAFVKLVLLGVGEEVDEAQMEELDDMFEGSGLCDPKGQPIDIWDHKLVSEMRSLAEIFAEVVSENVILTEWGKVYDSREQLVHHYSDGLPALLRFTLPAGSTAFTLELPNATVTQDLSEGLARL